MRRSTALYLALLGLVGLERLTELARSARHRRKALARGAFESGRGHWPAMVALHALFLPACAAEVALARRPFPRRLGWGALGAVVAAQSLRFWVVRTLGDRWNVRILVVPSDAPITRGPYRFLKHPNYAAVAIEVAALPLVHGAYWTAIAFSAANMLMLRTRIRAEERALGRPWAEAFGVPSPALATDAPRRTP